MLYRRGHPMVPAPTRLRDLPPPNRHRPATLAMGANAGRRNADKGGDGVARLSIRRRGPRPATRLIDPAAGWAAADVEAALTVPVDPGAAAFFDVDNTMMQGASIYYFARGLAARKYFTTGDLVHFAWRQ